MGVAAIALRDIAKLSETGTCACPASEVMSSAPSAGRYALIVCADPPNVRVHPSTVNINPVTVCAVR
eukprot:3080813-Pyramimonas_sp.AAC.1